MANPCQDAVELIEIYKSSQEACALHGSRAFTAFVLTKHLAALASMSRLHVDARELIG